jgi:hypothetical protein
MRRMRRFASPVAERRIWRHGSCLKDEPHRIKDRSGSLARRTQPNSSARVDSAGFRETEFALQPVSLTPVEDTLLL